VSGIDELLSSNALDSAGVTKMFCYFLLSIIEDTSESEISFPDSLMEFIQDYLGEDTIRYLKLNLSDSDTILSEVINSTEWIHDDFIEDAYDFLKFHIKEVRNKHVRK
jgi:hypothetical protein